MLRRLRNLTAAAILAVTPMATLLMPTVAHAAVDTCTWTGAVDSTFSNGGNWSVCDNAGVPESGDSLIFPVTAANLLANNDLVGATFNDITFNGTSGGGQGYGITGNAFTLSGDITDSSDQDNSIDNDITISSPTIITVTAVDGNLELAGALTGSGAVTKEGDGTVSFLTTLALTGAIVVNAGTLTTEAPNTDAPFSSLTVADQATFRYDMSAMGATLAISKPITLDGTLFFSAFPALGSPSTLNLTGTLTLTGNAYMMAASNVNVHIQGPLQGPGFVLEAVGAGTVTNDSSSNNTATPSGLLASVGGAGATPEADAPAAPDTGFALVSANPIATMAVTIMAAGSILAIARLTRNASSRR